MAARGWMLRTGALLAAVLSILAFATTTGRTTAAWTDRVYAAAVATAGTWHPGYPPFAPGDDTTVLSAPTWQFPDTNGGGATVATSTVSSTRGGFASWSVLISVDQAPYWGMDADDFAGSLGVTFSPVPGDPSHVRMSGWIPLLPGETRTVRVYSWNDAAPVADASWYTVTASPAGEWTATSACLDITVAGTVDEAVYPFFYGWRTEVDLSAAISAMTAAGGVPTSVEWQPAGVDLIIDPATTAPPADRYTVTGGTSLALRGERTTSFRVCLTGVLAESTADELPPSPDDEPAAEAADGAAAEEIADAGDTGVDAPTGAEDAGQTADVERPVPDETAADPLVSEPEPAAEDDTVPATADATTRVASSGTAAARGRRHPSG